MKAHPADEDVNPTCPACREALEYVLYKDVASQSSDTGGVRAYLCPHCSVLLAVAR